MNWTSDAYEGHVAEGGHETWHQADALNSNGDPIHQLVVKHSPRYNRLTHVVRLDTDTGTHRFHFPSEKDKTKAFISTEGKSHYVNPPSEDLRHLIESHNAHHTNPGSWMSLLDQLVAEYPELIRPVEQHTAARAAG